jgi:transcriptional regulator with XRE-family HTH domain
MSQDFRSPRHEALRAFLVKKRKKAGLTQIDLGKILKRNQAYVSYVERGRKLLAVVELMRWAEAIGFDAREAIRELYKIRGI